MATPLLSTSSGRNLSISGKFCFPEPITFNGLYSAAAVVKSVPNITNNGAGIATVTTDGNHNYNDGDQVMIYGSTAEEYNGIKKITKLNATQFTFYISFLVTSPATGTIFSRLPETKATGVGTKIEKAVSGSQWMYIPNNDICRKVSRIVSDTEWYFDDSIVGAVADIVNSPVCVPGGSLRGISIKCSGDGTVQGSAVVENDTPTFFWPDGLTPVCGNSGANTFNILIQD